MISEIEFDQRFCCEGHIINSTTSNVGLETNDI